MKQAIIPYVNCVTCSQPIWLPLPTREETPIARRCRTRDGWQLKIACPVCGLAHRYQGSDVHWNPLDNHVQRTYRETLFLRIESECEERCAGTRIVWYTRVGIPTGVESSALNETTQELRWELKERIEDGFYKALSCTLAHPISPVFAHGQRRIERGQDWWLS
jgi:hypothetical protein